MDEYVVKIRLGGETSKNIHVNSQELSIIESKLKSQNQTILIWHWYWISGVFTTNKYFSKLLYLQDILYGKSSPQAAIILVIETDEDTTIAREDLYKFINIMLPSIMSSLNNYQ